MQNCTTIKLIIEMLEKGCTYAEIRARCHIGASVVTDIKNKFSKMDMKLDELKKLSPKQINKLFYPDVHRKENRPMPDYSKVYRKITARGSKDTIFHQW